VELRFQAELDVAEQGGAGARGSGSPAALFRRGAVRL